MGEFASRFTGSSDLYQDDGRKPYASVNFVTAHDGFTLRDLVSYNEKHNQANGEDNRDGESHNRSWNCGVEGATDDPEIDALRRQQQRNFLTTLLLSQGISMLLGGDEIGRTQQGNNNAYCQDNEISWFDWEHVDDELLEFTRRLIRLQAEHPVFRRRGWFKGRPLRGRGVSDIAWFRPDGDEMSEEDWQQPHAKAFAVFLNGDALREVDDQGRSIRDDSFLLLFNAHHEPLAFTMPPYRFGSRWNVLVDTAMRHESADVSGGARLDVAGRSVVVLSRPSAR
jgi:glycogen operon protein